MRPVPAEHGGRSVTPEQINRILAANTARCTPDALAQIAEGKLTTEQWQQSVRMTAELMHALHTKEETE